MPSSLNSGRQAGRQRIVCTNLTRREKQGQRKHRAGAEIWRQREADYGGPYERIKGREQRQRQREERDRDREKG